MPVSKLKNLILLILALAAAFLLLLVVPPRLAQRQERQAVYDRLQAFLAENGVELTPEALPVSRGLCVLELADAQSAASTAAGALLGQTVFLEEDSTRYTQNFTSAAGRCTFGASGSFEAVLTGEAASGSPESQARELLRKMGFSCAELTVLADTDSGGTLLHAVQQTQDAPIFGGGLTLRYDKTGALRQITGTFYPGADDTLRVGGDVCISCADAVIALLARRDTLGWVGGSITGIRQGYRHADTASGAVRLTPVWRIDTDVGSFYVGGIDRTVTLCEGT